MWVVYRPFADGADIHQMWRIAAMFNKQSRMAIRNWSCSLMVALKLKISDLTVISTLQSCRRVQHLDELIGTISAKKGAGDFETIDIRCLNKCGVQEPTEVA